MYWNCAACHRVHDVEYINISVEEIAGWRAVASMPAYPEVLPLAMKKQFRIETSQPFPSAARIGGSFETIGQGRDSFSAPSLYETVRCVRARSL